MADPISAIILAATKIGAAIYAAYKAYKVVRIVVAIAALLAVSAAASALVQRPTNLGATQGQELTLKLDPTMPRQVAVGRVATGGSLVYAFTYAGTDQHVDNQLLVRVIALSDRPISGLVKVMEGNATLTFEGDPTTGLVGCYQYRPSGAICLALRIYKGSDTPTADAFLIDKSGGAWTSNHKGKGIAYAIVQYAYIPDAFPNGEPQLTFILDGAACYDDREDVDLEGTQSISDPATWTYSRNAAVIAHQFLRGFKTGSSTIVGSQADARDINPADAIAAANTCDEVVDLDAGGTETRYRASLLLTASNTVQTDLEDLKLAMDGQIYDRGGHITILPGGTRTPVMNLDDGDIIWTEEKSYQPFAGLSALYNMVQGSYIPEEADFAAEPYATKKDNTFIAADGGERIVRNQDFKAVNSRTQVQRITARYLAASRFQKTIGFVGPLWLLELEQGDWFTLTCERWGFTTKYFVVQAITITKNFQAQLIAQETSTTVDGWDPADEVPRTVTTPVNPGYILPVPTLTLTALAETQGAIEIPVIKYDLSILLGSAATAYTLQLRKTATPGVIQTLPVIPLADPSGLIMRTILPSTSYELRARSTDGRLSSTWTSWEEVTTTDTLSFGDASSIGGVTAAELLAQLADSLANSTEALAEGQQAIADARLIAEAQIQSGLTQLADKAYTDLQTTVDGDNLTTLMNLIGRKDGLNAAFILDTTTLKLSGSESLVDRLTTYSAQFGGSASSFLLTQVTSAASASAASATLLNLLGAANGASTAFILNSSTVKVDSSGQSLAAYINSLSVSSGSVAAIADSRISVSLGPGGPIASAISTVQTTANNSQATATLALNTANGDTATIAALTQVGGVINGIRIAGGASGNITFAAPNFYFVDSGQQIIPLAYTGGQWVFNVNIKARNIDANVITANMIVGGAISTVVHNEISTGQSLGSSGRKTELSFSFTTTGGKVVINLYAEIGTSTASAAGALIWVNWSGADIGLAKVYCPGSWGGSSTSYMTAITPAAGTYTLTIQYEPTGGSGAAQINHTVCVVTELKR